MKLANLISNALLYAALITLLIVMPEVFIPILGIWLVMDVVFFAGLWLYKRHLARSDEALRMYARTRIVDSTCVRI